MLATFLIWCIGGLISLPPLFSSFVTSHHDDTDVVIGKNFSFDETALNFYLKTKINDSTMLLSLKNKNAYNMNTIKSIETFSNLSSFKSNLLSFKITMDGKTINELKKKEKYVFNSNKTVRLNIFETKDRTKRPMEIFDSKELTCELANEPRYVVYSALGSFYIPLLIMVFAYFKVYTATKARLRKRAKMRKKLIKDVVKQNRSGSFLSSETCVKKKLFENKDKKIELVCKENAESFESEIENKMLVGNLKKEDISEIPMRNNQKYCSIESNDQDETNKTQNKPECFSKISTTFSATSQVTARMKKQKTFIEVEENKINKNRLQNAYKTFFSRIKKSYITDSTENETRLDLKKEPTKKAISYQSGHINGILEEKQRISLSLERRAARTMAIIMGAFVACWLPFFVYYVIDPFCPPCLHSPLLMQFFVWLGYINSAINPIIYTIFNIDFRRSFKQILQGSCCNNVI